VKASVGKFRSLICRLFWIRKTYRTRPIKLRGLPKLLLHCCLSTILKSWHSYTEHSPKITRKQLNDLQILTCSSFQKSHVICIVMWNHTWGAGGELPSKKEGLLVENFENRYQEFLILGVALTFFQPLNGINSQIFFFRKEALWEYEHNAMISNKGSLHQLLYHRTCLLLRRIRMEFP